MSMQQVVRTLLDRLLAAEKMPAADRAAQQATRLSALVQFAEKESPWFAERLKAAGLAGTDVASPEALRRLPPLTRRELQSRTADIFCRRTPSGHGPRATTKTSGSSGEPVEIYRTALNQAYWLANGLREHLWYKRDAGGRLAALRANLPGGQPVEQAGWGPPIGLFFKTGPALGLPINLPVPDMVARLRRFDPHYLLVYPGSLAAQMDEMAQNGLRYESLKQVRTIGEMLPAHLRRRVRTEWGVDVVDVYSSQELGQIAIQCPQSGLYHIMAESLIVEILDAQGHPCAEGETGRVVATDLTNCATPLFRYDIGDYAEVGPACPCGRTLPTLKSIRGRERNMIVVKGKKVWPLIGFHHYDEVVQVLQYQFIQKSAERIEARFVVKGGKITPEQEERLAAIIRRALGHDFQLDFVYYPERIPLSPSGKFEDIVCEI